MNLPRKLRPGDDAVPLFDQAASRRIEQQAMASLPAHSLIERAGAAIARWALAMAPHAERIWVAAGPGNNGGDGLVAARLLHAAGKSVHVSWLGDPHRLPPDAAHAHRQALLAGLALHESADIPGIHGAPPELALDALLGLGQSRAPEGRIAQAVAALDSCRQRGAMLLAVDLPTGLCADTGRALGEACVRANATLTLLTAKPGLFTAQGRDAAGDVWCDDLGVALDAQSASARLSGRADARTALAPRLDAAHATHKGRFGDVWVIGGAPGMVGAAQLAARASLHSGAGRVYLSLLGAEGAEAAPHGGLELMQRSWREGQAAGLADQATVVCGCGGGDAVRSVLPELLHRVPRLVLDADALNALASDTGLATQLESRGRRGLPTVLTPHPLEAARLLGISSGELQANRIDAAKRLAQRFSAVVLLKGSGSVVAMPAHAPSINPTGNARLASAGTGDVLAGWLGGCWSSHGDTQAAPLQLAAQVAISSAWLHGRAAERACGRGGLPLPAGALIEAMAALANALA
ncbi:MAG TPA: NAD(P)H-hydrate dehydratase [Ideonella sp.]|nr:NAD(P)H-hydrate dehydratase [Ideonella sp.]